MRCSRLTAMSIAFGSFALFWGVQEPNNRSRPPSMICFFIVVLLWKKRSCLHGQLLFFVFNDVVFIILQQKQGVSCSYSCGSNTLCIRSDSHGGSVLQAQNSRSVFVHFHKFEALSVGYGIPCIVFFVIDQIYRFVFSFLVMV